MIRGLLCYLLFFLKSRVRTVVSQSKKISNDEELIQSDPICVTNIISEPNYKYGQQEYVTVRNHNRNTALERSVLKFCGGGGVFNRLYGFQTSPSASVMAQNT